MALHVQHLWANATRGPGSRIARGLVLWSKFKNDGISMHVSGRSKQELQDFFRRAREKNARAQVEETAREKRLSEDVSLATTLFEEKRMGPGMVVKHSSSSQLFSKKPGSISVKEILSSSSSGNTGKNAPPALAASTATMIQGSGRKRSRTGSKL
jgi:hypothetical protein